MTFLKKLLNLSGCTKLKPSEDNELVDRKDDDGDVLIGGNKAHRHNYVPWQSPTISSRRMLSRVRNSPRVEKTVQRWWTTFSKEEETGVGNGIEDGDGGGAVVASATNEGAETEAAAEEEAHREADSGSRTGEGEDEAEDHRTVAGVVGKEGVAVV